MDGAPENLHDLVVLGAGTDGGNKCSCGQADWLKFLSCHMFVWGFNTIDAVMLTWCAVQKRDAANTLLNGFWILVGAIGIWRASGLWQ